MSLIFPHSANSRSSVPRYCWHDWPCQLCLALKGQMVFGIPLQHVRHAFFLLAGPAQARPGAFASTSVGSRPVRQAHPLAGPPLSFYWRCCYCDCMSVAVTVRDVPDKVRDELAARAARAGMSLQEYLRGMLVESASRPAVDDVISRARARVEATGVRVDAKSIIAARDADRR